MGRRKKNKVVFDKELITKEVAEKIVAERKLTEPTNTSEKIEQTQHTDTKTRKKKKKQEKREKLQDAEGENQEKPRKRKRDTCAVEDEDSVTVATAPSTESENTEELNPAKPEIKREESIRARKRKKHAELLQERKLKAELGLQQKCLNYLSQWKHTRDAWKFEKLKQVWLQQNMFDSAKVPEEFWDILVEYFSGCKGKARGTIVQAALKIIESEEEKTNDNNISNVKRARDVIQNLQE